jgi:phage terminase large subunit GpA-like protein
MQDSLSIHCPHCGEAFGLAFDPTEGSAEFVVDCEICCRPMVVTLHVDDAGELESLDVVEE